MGDKTLTDMVLVPRDLITSTAGELRSWSGHWATGTARLESIVKHDTRMPDGSCCTCALLAELDEYAGRRPFDLGNPYGWTPAQIEENERRNAELGAPVEDDDVTAVP